MRSLLSQKGGIKQKAINLSSSKEDVLQKGS